VHPDAVGALKELLFRVARRSGGSCESCRRVTTIKFYSPIDGIASDDLALMLCAICADDISVELAALSSISAMRQRIATLLDRATT